MLLWPLVLSQGFCNPTEILSHIMEIQDSPKETPEQDIVAAQMPRAAPPLAQLGRVPSGLFGANPVEGLWRDQPAGCVPAGLTGDSVHQRDIAFRGYLQTCLEPLCLKSSRGGCCLGTS